MNSDKLRKGIRIWLSIFIAGLVVSGLTAFPLETELYWLLRFFSDEQTLLHQWLAKMHKALEQTNQQYPQLAYGSDWLAFAHLVIGVVFIGPLHDPVRNIWVLQFGRIACVMVLPLAFIAGSIREIPLFWRLVDCSFGILGLVPLTICLRYTRRLEVLTEKNFACMDQVTDLARRRL